MEKDRQAVLAKRVGYSLLGLTILMLAAAIILFSSGQKAMGLALLASGLSLFTIGIVAVAIGKNKSKPPT